MPSRSIDGLGCGIDLDALPVLDVGDLRRSFFSSGATITRLLAGDRRQRDLGALRLIGEQVHVRVHVVLVLGEQAAKDLDLAAVLGELLLLRDRRVVDVDVERQLALGVDDRA